jgi:hypothetical protein
VKTYQIIPLNLWDGPTHKSLTIRGVELRERDESLRMVKNRQFGIICGKTIFTTIAPLIRFQLFYNINQNIFIHKNIYLE